MKLTKYIGIISSLMLVAASQSMAVVTLNTQFGQAFNSSGAPVPDGTLWALIVDDGDNVLPGGMAVNSGLALSSSAAINATFQTGMSLTVGGNLGLDKIFAMGAFNGGADLGVAGTTTNALPGLAGLTTGRAFGFYFFPGVTYSSSGANLVGTQVGGVNTTANDAGAGTVGMVIPADGALVFTGANTNAGGNLGGSTPEANFRAVNLIPETSTALLGALGALGLLRRRR